MKLNMMNCWQVCFQFNLRRYNEEGCACNRLLVFEVRQRERSEVNTRRPIDGATQLFIAALHGDEDEVARLIDMGADVNLGAGIDETPLFAAACTGRVRVVELLLAVPGVDVNRVERCRLTLSNPR